MKELKLGVVGSRNFSDYSDELIAFYDGRSPGTKNTIMLANQSNKKIKVVLYEGNEKTCSN